MLLDLLQKIFEQEKRPVEWRDSVSVPMFKENGDIQDCGNYRGIKMIYVMYADIAAHSVMRSLFLRLTVNDVMSAPVVEYRNKHVRIRSSCVVITTL